MLRITAATVVFLSVYSVTATAQVTYTAKVVSVSDGDTITVLRDKTVLHTELANARAKVRWEFIATNRAPLCPSGPNAA